MGSGVDYRRPRGIAHGCTGVYRGPRTVTRRCAIADPRLDRQLAEDGGWGETLDGL